MTRHVAAALLLACLAGGASAATLLTHVRGYTWSADGLARFDSLRAGDDGRVAAVGNGIEPAPNDTVRDAGGAVVLPGLIDAHGHFAGLGAALTSLDLTTARTRAEALSMVADYARANSGHPWILGRGWNQANWGESGFPDAVDLDAVVADRPVWLIRVDGHAGWANSLAMARAGFAPATADPDGGAIIRSADGTPTGVFVDAAMALIDAHVPPPDAARIETWLLTAQQQLLSVGITGVHDAGVDPATLGVLAALERDARLAVRVYAMRDGHGLDVDPMPSPVIDARDRLTIRSVKLYADGALGSRGAALLEPYVDQPGNTGLLFIEAPALATQVRTLRAAGYQVNVHAIGDRAVRTVLDAFAQAGALASERHRVEHAQVIALADIPRFAAAGVIASMQPTHATSDMNMAEARIGSERIKGAYAWRRLLASGARIASGSDFPVELSNPFFGWHAAVARTDRAGQPAGGWYPDERMTREEAFRTFTADAAFAGFAEDRLGVLAPGAWADFIVVDRDPFTVAEADIANVRVRETWIAGEQVFIERPAAGAPPAADIERPASGAR